MDSLDPSYNYGSNVAISATPDPNMEFVGWLGDGVAQPGFAQTTVLMDQDRNITAVFEPRDFNVYINQQGKGTTSGAGQHEYNSTINISANPATGYEFSHWEGFGPDSNVSENTTLTIQQDHALVAVFLPLEYNITTSSSTGGTVSIVEDSLSSSIRTTPFLQNLISDMNFPTGRVIQALWGCSIRNPIRLPHSLFKAMHPIRQTSPSLLFIFKF